MTYGFLSSIILAVIMQTCLAASFNCEKLPHIIDPTTCCSIPELITAENVDRCKQFSEEAHDAFVPMANEKRSRHSKKPPPKDAGHPENSQYYAMDQVTRMSNCFINCLFNDTGILENGKLNEAGLSSHLKKIITDMPDLVNILENSFKTCSYKAEKSDANLPSAKYTTRSISLTTVCPPVASELSACAFMETFKNCPSSVFSKTRECNDLRDHMNNCMT